MKRLLLAGIILTLLGCATVDTKIEGNKINKNSLMNLKPGTTTRQAIFENFGSPAETTYDTANNEEKMVYKFKEKKTPSYLGGMVQSEVQSKEETDVLELILRNNVLYSYRFKSLEN